MKMKNSTKSIKKLIHQNGFCNTLKIILFHGYSRTLIRYTDLSNSHTIRVNGYDIKTMPNDKGISAELLKFGTHEPITTKLLSKYLKDGMTCLDVGSNIGYYVFLESNLVGKSGKVIAIEPSPQNFKVLNENLSLQKNSNIELFNFACGNEDGEVLFQISNSSNWSRVKDDYINSNDRDIVSDIKVKLRKIDSFLNEKKLSHLDLIRMDTEGYELKIYPGMRETIKKFKPMISMEVHRSILGSKDTIRLLKLLQDDGYEIKFYIHKHLDYAIIGKMKDVKDYSINEVIEKIMDDEMPDEVGMCFVNQEKK